MELLELGVEIIYMWIGNDPENEDDGWKIQDTRLSEDREEQNWYISIGEAEQAFYDQASSYTPPLVQSSTSVSAPQRAAVAQEVEDDDDDYWNMYDRTPARTPMLAEKQDTPSEGSYYARYSDVQPMLEPGPTSTSLTGINIPLNTQPSYSPLSTQTANTASTTPPAALSPTFAPHKDDCITVTYAPRPRSVTSSSSSTRESIARLEENAGRHIQNEVGIKQHISTTIKSLYRLSKVTGIQREEFERILQAEVAVLAMMDEGDDGETW